ncbi:adhesion G protein-coupled receptor L3-like isoform X2 [Ornithodoros turicata]|uniref:adhesion G protein-coupled receptor L3-like isoform X2 n=1 Tax=Ornithodoros turicata TaxID=34597 RepID=UPI003138BC9D
MTRQWRLLVGLLTLVAQHDAANAMTDAEAQCSSAAAATEHQTRLADINGYPNQTGSRSLHEVPAQLLEYASELMPKSARLTPGYLDTDTSEDPKRIGETLQHLLVEQKLQLSDDVQEGDGMQRNRIWHRNRRRLKRNTLLPERAQCESQVYRNVTWPATDAGQCAEVVCTAGAIGIMTWCCGPRGYWRTPTPSTAQCVQHSILYLQNMIILPGHDHHTTPSLRQSMEAVNQILTYVEIRVGGDLLAIVDLLEAIAEASKNGSSQLNATNAVLIGQDTADTADKLLTHDDPWIEVPLQTRLSCATTLLETVDGAGILLSASGRRNFLKKNFKMNIVSSASRNVLGEVITLPQDGKVSTLSTGTVQIHLAANKQSPKLYNQTVVIVYTEFPRLDRILGIQEDENYCCGELRQELNSPVISARVGTEISSTLHLAEHVIITVPMLQRNARHPTCVFWDTIINDWSPEGCEVESQNGTHVVCLCRHLSNFAVLMDIHGVLRDTPHGQSLAIITSVGCSISIMCLGFCIIIFGGFRALRNTRTSIHLNVCLSLFAAELVLLYGMDQTENKTVCAVMAGVLHYSFLSAFSWMLLEGFHITFLLVKVFNTSRQRPLRYYAFGYGLPLIIVATTALIRPHGYGTSQHCWLSHQDGVFWSYTGPVAFILLVNIAVLLFTIRTTSRLSKATTANARAETARRWIRTTVIMLPLLGLTWIPGFLLFDDSTGSVVMTYFFCVLNSLQGFGFFLFHCALNRSVRRVLLNKLESVQCVRRYVNSRLRRSSTSDERYTSSSLSSDGRMIATIFGRRRSLSFDTTDSSVDDPMAGKFTPTLVTSGVLPYYASGDLIKEEPEKK